jgi:ketosteroid isomerase-like protein
VPPTGKKVTDGRFCEVFRFRNGRIAQLTNYQDVASWLRQIGVA